MSKGFDIKIDKIDWNDKKIISDIEKLGIQALEASADKVLERSNDYVPYDTGKLKRSGKVKRDEDGVSISYDADHAISVHETPRNYKGGKKYKYLERAIQDEQKTIQETIAKELKKAFK